MSRRRPLSVGEIWTERLGLESAAAIPGELEARLANLVTVVTTDVPPAGSAEAAVAYGDLWALTGFLTDARRVLTGLEVRA